MLDIRICYTALTWRLWSLWSLSNYDDKTRRFRWEDMACKMVESRSQGIVRIVIMIIESHSRGYLLVNTYIAMENHHLNIVKSTINGPFSIAMLNSPPGYQSHSSLDSVTTTMISTEIIVTTVDPLLITEEPWQRSWREGSLAFFPGSPSLVYPSVGFA